ncbi:SMI1 / KNR4 family (SUKH-1) [Nonomuraea solani]|uniref:SMI1 / KNR4 family (SUKH-1) n=1 Tax=Nonomuraea solani TaxID=1144553 RepID=A0A1H6EFK3_9ACTN|nr:SMI1/KNR4 family protein [Nonomuraea solani]SEG96578.1 SMI1 / KNR4 family (SUKH-1) [Nonomuraea solani]
MIISRRLWLAVAAALAAAAIVVVVRSRRRPVPVPQEAPAPAVWPAAPILGTPTADDLARYAPRPSVFDRPAFARLAGGGAPRRPFSPVVRRRLYRWGAAGLVLVLLAAGTQALESAVFSGGLAGDSSASIGPCDESQVACAVFDVEPGLEVSAYNLPNPYDPAQEPAEPAPHDADCRPRPTGEATMRRPGAKTTRAVNRQWRRIETWLKANAPAGHRELGGPARPAAIAAAEQEMGLRFPDDLKASLLRHDGSVRTSWGFGPLGYGNLSVKGIRETWLMLCDIDDEDGEDPRSEWWDGRMIPFGSNGMGDHLVIDSVRRDVGQTDHEGSMSFTPGETRIRSYHALLKATADALENGGPIGRWKPKAENGDVIWDLVG